MKKLLLKMQKKVVSSVLAFSMMFGFCYSAFPKSMFEHEHVHAHAEETDTINYVSLGDSMTNGYGFEGYRQGNYAEGDSFPYGTGIYGEGSYALQFADWLEEETGKEVNHAQMASSACRAEDLLYLLGGREKPTDGWFTQVLNYTGASKREGRLQIVKGGEEELKQLYVGNVKDADIISLAMGNASFGAYLMQYVTGAFGVLGGSLPEDEVVSLEDALVVIDDAKTKEIVMKAYDKAMQEFYAMLPAGFAESEEFAILKDVMSYVVAGFLLNYMGVIEKIVELNPDVEIILVGLMNTTSGLSLTDENGEVVFDIGATLDKMFGVLNAYVETLPAVLKMAKKTADVTFYYVENLHINFISQEFDNLASNGWATIEYKDEDGNVYGKLSGDVVRSRTIESYNDALAPMIGAGFGMSLPEITLADVQEFEDTNPDWSSFPAPKIVFDGEHYVVVLDDSFNPTMFNGFLPENPTDLKNLTIAIYLGIEDAIATSMGATEIPLEALLTLTSPDGLTGVLTGFMPNLNPSAMLNDTQFGIDHPQYGYVPGANVMMPDGSEPFKGVEIPYYGNNGIDTPNAIRDALGSYFTSTETLKGMCLIFGMFKIGNGMSVHPTPKTHYDIFNKMVETYKAGYTTDDAFEDNAKALAEKLEELAKEYGPEIVEKAKSLIKKYGPEIIKQIPNWVEQYGPTVLEFIEKYGPAVVSKVAPFVKKYGSIVLEKAYEYAVNAGYVAYVDEMISTVEGKLEEMRAQLVDLRQMIIDGAYTIKNNIVNGAKDFVAPMAFAGMNTGAVAMRTSINVAPCQTILEEAEDAVNGAISAAEAEINAQVEELLAVVNARIAEIEALITDAQNMAMQMLLDAVAGVQEMMEDFANQVQTGINNTQNAVKNYVEETLAKIEATVNEFNAKVQAAVAEFEAVATETIATIQRNLEALAEDVQQKYLEFVEVVENVKETLDKAAEFVDMLSNLTMVEIKDVYAGAFVTDYTYFDIDEKVLNYLALGDATVDSYANTVASLWNGWTVNVVTNKNAGTVSALLASMTDTAVVDQIANANVISLNFSNTAILDFVKAQVLAELKVEAAPTELNWAKLVGEDGVQYVEQILDIVRVRLQAEMGTEEIMPGVDAVELAMVAIESYAYSYIELNVSYMQVVNAITAINPTAKILMVGMYNPFDGLVIADINVGDYVDYLVNAMGVEYAAYAMTSDNFAFVDVANVEMANGGFAGKPMLDILVDFITGYYIDYAVPTADSYAFIAEQIANAINFVELESGHVHNYEAVVTDPTCTEGGYTTYTCSCGDSYVADYVDATGHNFTANKDADSHWMECTCGEKKDVTAHSFTANKDENSHWMECTCGEKKDVTAHNFTANKDANSHWMECTCGAKKDVTAHNFTANKDENSHWMECTCGAKKDVTAHNFTANKDANSHWMECTCGEKKDVTAHNFTANKDANSHWMECTCGEKKDVTAHNFTANKDANSHWMECTCGEKKDVTAHNFTANKDANSHWMECTCGAKKDVAAHNFTANKDANSHWMECTCGEKKDVTAHNFTANKDANSHWMECTCGEKKDVTAHNFTANKDANSHWMECTCGEKKDVTAHNFTANKDANNHWMECACGEKKDVAPHTMDDGVEADGVITYSCDCGYQVIEEVEPVSTGAIVAVAASSVVVAGGGAFTIVWFAVYKKSAADLVTAVKNVFKRKK